MHIKPMEIDEPINIIPLRRAGRPDIKVTTTSPITSDYMKSIAAHVALVEKQHANLKPATRYY